MTSVDSHMEDSSSASSASKGPGSSEQKGDSTLSSSWLDMPYIRTLVGVCRFIKENFVLILVLFFIFGCYHYSVVDKLEKNTRSGKSSLPAFVSKNVNARCKTLKKSLKSLRTQFFSAPLLKFLAKRFDQVWERVLSHAFRTPPHYRNGYSGWRIWWEGYSSEHLCKVQLDSLPTTLWWQTSISHIFIKIHNAGCFHADLDYMGKETGPMASQFGPGVTSIPSSFEGGFLMTYTDARSNAIRVRTYDANGDHSKEIQLNSPSADTPTSCYVGGRAFILTTTEDGWIQVYSSRKGKAWQGYLTLSTAVARGSPACIEFQRKLVIVFRHAHNDELVVMQSREYKEGASVSEQDAVYKSIEQDRNIVTLKKERSASSPVLALSKNKLHVFFKKSDDILRYTSTTDGTKWSASKSLSEASIGNPAVLPFESGRTAVVWVNSRDSQMYMKTTKNFKKWSKVKALGEKSWRTPGGACKNDICLVSWVGMDGYGHINVIKIAESDNSRYWRAIKDHFGAMSSRVKRLDELITLGHKWPKEWSWIKKYIGGA